MQEAGLAAAVSMHMDTYFSPSQKKCKESLNNWFTLLLPVQLKLQVDCLYCTVPAEMRM
jgi:hypothetical protein